MKGDKNDDLWNSAPSAEELILRREAVSEINQKVENNAPRQGSDIAHAQPSVLAVI